MLTHFFLFQVNEFLNFFLINKNAIRYNKYLYTERFYKIKITIYFILFLNKAIQSWMLKKINYITAVEIVSAQRRSPGGKFQNCTCYNHFSHNFQIFYQRFIFFFLISLIGHKKITQLYWICIILKTRESNIQ